MADRNWQVEDARPGRGRRALALSVATFAVLTGMVSAAPPALAAPVQPVGDATATVETAPVSHTGDAADDPAIWLHPTDPAMSVVIGNDKGGALEVYDLAGARIQRIAEGNFFGNVDVRKGFVTGTGTVDIVVTVSNGIRIYTIDPGTRQLSNITDSSTGSIPTGFGAEGVCLYRSTSGETHAFVNARSGRMGQFHLTDVDGDGQVEATVSRDWSFGSEVEGCVVDDATGDLYVSQEAVGIWKYGAEPTDPTTPASRTLVDGVTADGGHLDPDVEGLTIVNQPDGAGYLIASSQAASDTLNKYVVYDRQGSNGFIRSFKVVTGPATDGCARTDGIDALAANLGPAFPHGIFICQDNTNSAPGPIGNQNFKFVPLERVVGLAGVQPPVVPSISYVGQAMSNTNTRNHSVVVPATVSVGDGLLLFLATNTAAAVVNPTGVTGWLSVGTLTGSGTVTKVWKKVAGAGDAGATVTITGSAPSKANMALLAYRGTSALNPVATFARAAEVVKSASHVTPFASARATGNWAVSYWTHKDSTTTALTPPTGVTVRSGGTQTGGGRVTALVADSGAAVPMGSYGGLQATAAAGASDATMWTIILAPG